MLSYVRYFNVIKAPKIINFHNKYQDMHIFISVDDWLHFFVIKKTINVFFKVFKGYSTSISR